MIHFSGTVQVVGFRFTATRVADDCGLAGYVQNLHDGQVECLVEGEPADIDAFVADLRDRFADYISDTRQETLPYEGNLKGFGVRY